MEKASRSRSGRSEEVVHVVRVVGSLELEMETHLQMFTLTYRT